MFMVDIPDGEFNNNDADWLGIIMQACPPCWSSFFYRSAGTVITLGQICPG
jgi:hypothetical protein